jgi:hypothetical protein
LKKVIFQLYDVEKRGYLEKIDVLEMFDQVYKSFYQGQKVDIEAVNNAFETMDSNKDGRLSLEEFKQIAKHQPKILECFMRRPQKNSGNYFLLARLTECKCPCILKPNYMFFLSRL